MPNWAETSVTGLRTSTWRVCSLFVGQLIFVLCGATNVGARRDEPCSCLRRISVAFATDTNLRKPCSHGFDTRFRVARLFIVMLATCTLMSGAGSSSSVRQNLVSCRRLTENLPTASLG